VSKYPLEPLSRLRNRRVDEQRQELAARAQETAAAEQRLAASRLAAESATAKRNWVRSEEAAHAQSGQATVADWQQLAAFDQAARATEQTLRSGQHQAALNAEHAERAQARSLEVLAEARADARLSERHELAFTERVAKKSAQTEEEDALETWTAGVGSR
jgi:hypothetical protein